MVSVLEHLLKQMNCTVYNIQWRVQQSTSLSFTKTIIIIIIIIIIITTIIIIIIIIIVIIVI